MDKDEVFEYIICSIKDEIDEIINKSDVDYLIDWDEEGECGLWNYDFAMKEDIDTICKICEDIDMIDSVSTYVSDNDDEYNHTICCYIDIRDLQYRMIEDEYETVIWWNNQGLVIPK